MNSRNLPYEVRNLGHKVFYQIRTEYLDFFISILKRGLNNFNIKKKPLTEDPGLIPLNSWKISLNLLIELELNICKSVEFRLEKKEPFFFIFSIVIESLFKILKKVKIFLLKISHSS